jgi:hypothetical protein
VQRLKRVQLDDNNHPLGVEEVGAIASVTKKGDEVHVSRLRLSEDGSRVGPVAGAHKPCSARYEPKFTRELTKNYHRPGRFRALAKAISPTVIGGGN